MRSKETIECLDKSRIQFSEYQKFKEDKQSLAKRIYELQSDLSREKSKNEKLIEELKSEKQLNAEIKKRLIEVEYDCEEFNHEYCDPNCNGKRKETIDLLQLIFDGLNETLLKQKDEENKQLAKRICEFQSDLSREKSKNENLEQQIEQLEIDNYNHNANLQRVTDMLDEAIKIIKNLLWSEKHRCTGEEFSEIRDKAEIFVRYVEDE